MALTGLDIIVEPDMDELIKVQRFALQNFKSPDLASSENAAAADVTNFRKYSRLDQVIQVLMSNVLTKKQSVHYNEVSEREVGKESSEILLTIF